MSAREIRFFKKVGMSFEGVTPGFCLQAFLKGRKVMDVEVGETWRYYDWASLTKIVFSATATMMAVDDRRFKTSDAVTRFLPWFESKTRKEPTQIRHLLTHTAGLEWWKPYYQETMGQPEPRLVLAELLRRDVTAQKRRKVGGTAVYSDLDLFILGMILETAFENDLLSIWLDVNERLQLPETRFHPGNIPVHAKSLYAPTEDCPLRGRVLQGEVHDENTWALQGVAPHAGLFGPIEDLSTWGLLLRKTMRGENTPRFAKPATVRKHTRRALTRAQGDWALGFMMPSRGTASCGPLFSARSVGHTGFTGTSLWYDPQRDLLVTILSNRVYPTRENKKFQEYRPLLHTWVAETF